MGRTIEREGATCPDNVADAGDSVHADLILDVAAFEVGARICSTESESLARLSRIWRQRTDTMALPITMANTG
jgi:hypothetical protein